MQAIILSVGDELVLGQTVDTNSAWLSQQLASAGCGVKAHLTVGDDQQAIEQAIEESVGRCDVLVISGGIGPTEDDLTRPALAAALRTPLELNEAWIGRLEAFFRNIDRPMSPLNRTQAMIPRGAALIENTAGTAAGIDAPYISGDQKTICRIFAMPGVPREMKAMFRRDVLPHVVTASGGQAILSRTLHTFGLGESTVADKLKAHADLMRRDRNPSVGTTVSGGVVSLRINARFQSADEAVQHLDETVAACRAALGDLIYAQDADTLQAVVGRLLKGSGATVATAESCTGGLLAKMLTDVAGSSGWFKQGWVTYSNEAKGSMLGVEIPPEGAVSEQTVVQMAAAARDQAGADFALAISGIAGPDGGTPAKPVGTVCIALASRRGVTADPGTSDRETHVIARAFRFTGDREMIRDRSAKMALTMLRFRLLDTELPF